MKNRKLILFVVTIIFIYLVSYILIRKSNTEIFEVDGCPSEGCTLVRFPNETFYYIYSPLIQLDKRINHIEFRFKK